MSTIEQDGFQFSQVYLKRMSGITAILKANDSKPDYDIYSVDNDTIIKKLIVIPDANFKTNGILLVRVNETDFLPAGNSGDLTDIVAPLEIPLPVEGLKLKRSQHLRFYVWTGSGTSSALTIIALVSKNLKTPI